MAESSNVPEYGVSAHYTGMEGERYFAVQNANGSVTGRLAARLFSPHIKPEHSVLDFGCGSGNVLVELDCAAKLGVEINPAARQAALARGLDCVEGLDDVADGFADVVISNHVLEHIPNPVAALAAMRSKLKPDGTLMICTPLDDWRVQKRWTPDNHDHHLHTWTPRLMGNLLLEAGFQVKDGEVTIITYAWPPRVQVFESRLPRAAFDATCMAFSILARRRQVFAKVTV